MADEYEIVWSAGAIADIEDIAQWIRRDSPHYARQVVERLYMAGPPFILPLSVAGKYRKSMIPPYGSALCIVTG